MIRLRHHYLKHRFAVLVLILLPLSCGPEKIKQIPHPTPLISQVPSQALAPRPSPCTDQDRQFNQIRILISERQFTPALDLASKIADAPCSPEHYPRALALIAEIFRAKGKPVNAFYFYVQAATHSHRHKESTQNVSKAVSSISHMDGDNIIFLTEKTAPPHIQKQLLFMAGTSKAQTGDIPDALRLLKAFVSAFPNAPYAVTARTIINDLTRKPQVAINKIGILLPLTGYYRAGG